MTFFYFIKDVEMTFKLNVEINQTTPCLNETKTTSKQQYTYICNTT